MDNDTKQTISRRLATTTGHLKATQRMVEEDAYCIDIIRQIQAVQAALDKVNALLLDHHMHTCVTSAIRGDDASEREKMLKEITSVFTVQSKL
jgi:CsoR family transcriptional regulator, copper-sensing transcriptional repressor